LVEIVLDRNWGRKYRSGGAEARDNVAFTVALKYLHEPDDCVKEYVIRCRHAWFRKYTLE